MRWLAWTPYIMAPVCSHGRQTRAGYNDVQQRVVCKDCGKVLLLFWPQTHKFLIQQCLEAQGGSGSSGTVTGDSDTVAIEALSLSPPVAVTKGSTLGASLMTALVVAAVSVDTVVYYAVLHSITLSTLLYLTLH